MKRNETNWKRGKKEIRSWGGTFSYSSSSYTLARCIKTESVMPPSDRATLLARGCCKPSGSIFRVVFRNLAPEWLNAMSQQRSCGSPSASEQRAFGKYGNMPFIVCQYQVANARRDHVNLTNRVMLAAHCSSYSEQVGHQQFFCPRLTDVNR